MRTIMEVMDDIEATKTLLPQTTMQLLTGHDYVMRSACHDLAAIRTDAMRRIVTAQRVNPTVALLDDLLLGATPRRWHEAAAGSRAVYDAYLADVRRGIDRLKWMALERLEEVFAFENSNIHTACELALESRYLTSDVAEEIEEWARHVHQRIAGNIEQQCALVWNDCCRVIPWEQRLRRWARRGR